MSFAGKVIMITGAASGIGADTARALDAQGARLVLSDVEGAGLTRVMSGLTGAHFGESLDVRDEGPVQAHVAAAVDRFGRLDGAVNAAGIAQDLVPLEETEVAVFDRIMAVNLRGSFLCLRAQMGVMKAQGHGAIVMMSSAAGLAGAGRMAAYAASKHAVLGLARSAAEEGARHGVRVNALCPAFTQTPMLDGIAAPMVQRHGRDGAGARLTQRIPMRRPAQVAEITQAVLWALSEENSYMTGAAIPLDGGLTAL